MDAVLSFYRPNPFRYGNVRRRRGGFGRGNRLRGRRQGRGRRGFRPGFRGRRNNNRGGFRGRGGNNRGNGRGNFRGNNRGGRGNTRGLVPRGGNEQQQNN